MEFEFKIKTSDGFTTLVADVEDFKDHRLLVWGSGKDIKDNMLHFCRLRVAQDMIAYFESYYPGDELLEWLERGESSGLNYVACRYIVAQAQAQAQPPNA